MSNTMPLEKVVESYLHRRVTGLGGHTMKFVSPATRGAPDRVVVVHGQVIFVEVKRDNGAVTDLQRRNHIKLARHGADVYVVYGKQGVDAFINQVVAPIINFKPAKRGKLVAYLANGEADAVEA